MSEWQNYTLGDLISISGGFGYKGEFIGRGDSVLLGMGCVGNASKFLISGARPYCGPCKESYFVKPGDIVLATRQQSDNLPILGLPALIPNELKDKAVIVGANLYKVTNKSNTPNSFLYWLLKNDDYYNHILSSAKGSTVRMITKDAVENYKFKLPPLKEQQAIAEVLSSLDDKIDLLHSNNKTLEEMAETLIKESCKSCKTILLGDIIEIYDNKRIPLSSIQRAQKKEGKLYPYYGAATIMDYVNDFIFDGDYILLGEDGTVQTEDGYPVLQRLQGKAWVNNHTHVISAKAPFNNDTLEMILKNTSVSHIVTGAVQPKINQGSLKNLELSVPENNIEDLCLSISTLMSKRENNNKQIGFLSTTRDTLLPKLMSGQVRVNI